MLEDKVLEAALSAGKDDIKAPEGNLYSDADRQRVKSQYGENWHRLSWFDQQRALAHDSWLAAADTGDIDEDTLLAGIFDDPEVQRINKREEEFATALRNALKVDVSRLSDDEAQGYYMDLVAADPRFGVEDEDGSKLFGVEAQYGKGNLSRLLGVYKGTNPNGLFSREAQRWLESNEAQKLQIAKERRKGIDMVLDAPSVLPSGVAGMPQEVALVDDRDVVSRHEKRLMANEKAVQFATLMGSLSPAGQEVVRAALKADELDGRTLRFLDKGERENAMAAYRCFKDELDANWWLTQGGAQAWELTKSMAKGSWRMLANLYMTTGGRLPEGSKEKARYEEEQLMQLQIEDAERYKYKDSLTALGKVGAGLLGTVPYMAAMSNPYTGTVATLAMSNDVRERMILEGVDPETALAVSLPVGIVEGWIEKIQWEGVFGGSLSEFAIRRASIAAVLKQLAKKKTTYLGGNLLRMGREAVVTTLTEDAEEVLQQLAEELGVSIAKGEFDTRQVAEALWDTAVESLPTTAGFGLMRVSGAGPALHRKFSRKSVASADFTEYIQSLNAAKNVLAQKEAPPPGGNTDGLMQKLLDDLRTRWTRTKTAKGRVNMLLDSGLTAEQAAVVDEFFRLESDFMADYPVFSYYDESGVVMHHFEISELPSLMKGVEKATLNEDGTYTLDLRLDKDTVVPVKVEAVKRSDLRDANREQFEKQVRIKYEEANGDGTWEKLSDDAKEAHLLQAVPGGFTTVTVGDETIPFAAVVQLAAPDRMAGDGGAKPYEVGHEIFHAATLIANKMGILTDEDIEKMKKVFGNPKAAGYLFNEEDAADAYGRFIASKLPNDELSAVFAKIRDFFRRILNALTRREGNEEDTALTAENIFKAIERGDLRGISALSGVSVNEDAAAKNGETKDGEAKTAEAPAATGEARAVAEVPGVATIEAEVVEVAPESLATKNDADFDPALAEVAPVIVNTEPADGVPVVVGGGNVLTGSDAVEKARREGRKKLKVKRIRKVKTAKKPRKQKGGKPGARKTLAEMNPFERNKFLSVKRFCEVHGESYPLMRFWLDNGHRIIARPDKGARAGDFLELLSQADRMFLTGFGKGGIAWDELPQEVGGSMADMEPEAILERALKERADYIAWKEAGGLSPEDAEAERDEARYRAEGVMEPDPWEIDSVAGTESRAEDSTADIDDLIEDDIANGRFSLEDTLSLLNNMAEQELVFGAPSAQEQYDAVVRRYTNADGSKKRGWMKAPNGKPTNLTERQWVQVRTPAFKAWFGDWEANAEMAGASMVEAKTAFRELMSRKAEARTADGATLRFVSQSAKAYSKEAERESADKPAHWCALANIESLVARARLMFEEEPRNGSRDIEAYVKYGAVFTHGGEKYLAKITSKRYPGHGVQNFYNVESVSVEKIAAHGIHEAIAKGQPLDAGDISRISKIIDTVNPGSVSKVVDANGEPQVMFHGSDAKRTVFEMHPGMDGEGAYFTSAFPEAADYVRDRLGNPEMTEEECNDYITECFLNVRDEGNLYASKYGGGYIAKIDKPTDAKSATDNTGAFGATNPDIRFSLAAPVERRKDLIALHNVDAKGLKGMDELGGLAAPSFAVTKDTMGSAEFGDISLIVRPFTIDPKRRGNKIFSNDAWTPTFPQTRLKMDENKLSAINERVDKAIRGTANRDWEQVDPSWTASVDSDNMSNAINNMDGDAVAALKDRDPLKITFVIETGRAPELEKHERNIFNMRPGLLVYADNSILPVVSEKLGDRLMPNGETISYEDAKALANDKAFQKELIDIIETADGAHEMREANREHDKNWSVAKELGEGRIRYPIFNTIRELSDILATWKRRGIPQDVDRVAAMKAVDGIIEANRDEYEEWLKKLTDGITDGKRYIRNNKDWYTPSGNRRSFAQLYDPLTLENAVKMMLKQQNSQGNGMFRRNEFGVAATEYKSLREVINDEDRLKNLSKEEKTELRDALSSRLQEIVSEYNETQKVPDDNPFTQHSRAADMMLDSYAIAKGNKQRLMRELNQFGYTASEELVDNFIEVMHDMSRMPEDYFEAKAYRAVGFDEIAAAAIPDNASAESREILARRNVRTVEYKAGDNADRLRAVNEAADQVGDARFSITGIYTGSAADYEKPSLKKIGTGEGAQVYGWGLYGSTERSVAEGYANRGRAERNRSRKQNDTFIDGKKQPWTNTPEGIAAKTFDEAEGDRGKAIATLRANVERMKGWLSDGKIRGERIEEMYRRMIANEQGAIKLLEDKSKKFTRKVNSPTPNANLYEQTWFTNREPGDESHLLKWYESVSDEQLDWIEAQIEREAFRDNIKYLLRESLKEIRNRKGRGRTGGEVYSYIANALNMEPSNGTNSKEQVASEFLARAGIDGVKYPVDSFGKTVKDGDKAGWNYVSFRDDNIRVDHKWTDGEQRFSLAQADLDRWNKILDDYEAGKIDVTRDYTVLTETPAVLQRIGAPNLPITIRGGIIKKLTGEIPTKDGRQHGIPASELRKLQIELDNPIAVFISKTQPNSLVVLTRIIDRENHERAVVAIKLDQSTSGKHNINVITSAYGKNKDAIAGWIADGYLRYINKQARKESARWLQLPGDSTLRARRVLTEKDFSNEQLGVIIPNSPALAQGGLPKLLPSEEPGKSRGAVSFSRDPADVISGMVAAKTRRGETVKVEDVQNILATFGADTSLAGDIIERGRRTAGRVGDIIKDKVVDDSTFFDLALSESKRSRVLALMERSGEEGYHLGAEDERSVAALAKAKSDAVLFALANATGFNAVSMELKYGFNMVQSVMNAKYHPMSKSRPGTDSTTPGEVDGPGMTLSEMEAAKAANGSIPQEVAARESAALAALKKKAAKRADEIDKEYGLKGGESPEQKQSKEDAAAGRVDETAEDAKGKAGNKRTGRRVRRDQLDFNRASDFLAFLEELVAKEMGITAFDTPVQVRTLASTAKHFLTKIARQLCYSHTREVVMADIDKLADQVSLKAVEASVMNIYASIQNRLIPEKQDELISSLEYKGRIIAEKGFFFSRGGDERERKVRAQVEEWWRRVKSYLRLDSAAVEEERNRLLEIIENRSELDDKEQDLKYRMAVDCLNALTQYGGLINKTPGEIADKSEEILSQLEGSRAELENAREENRIRTRLISNKIARAVLNPEAEKSGKAPKPGWFSRMMDSMIGALELRFRDLIRYSHGDVRMKAEQELQNIEDAISLASQNFNVRLSNAQRELDEILGKLYGSSKEGVRRLTETLDDEDRKLVAKQASTDTITRSWLLQRYVELAQTDDYSGNIAVNKRDGKWRDQFDQVFRKYISPDDLTFLAWMRNWYRQNLTDLNDNVLLPISGIRQYSPDENYFPVKMRQKTRQGVDAKAKAWSPLPSWLTPRVKNDLDFDERTDLLTMWYARMREGAASMAYAKLGLNLSDILLNPTFKDTVAANHGDVALKRLVEHITDIISGGARSLEESDDSIALADKLRAWQTNLTLSGNYISALKQMTSCPVYALRHDIDFGMVWRFMTDVDMDSIRRLMASDGWKARYDTGMSEAMQNAIRVNTNGGKGGANFLNRLYNSGFKVMEFGDAVPCVWVGQGLLRYFTAKIRDTEGGNAAMSEDEIAERALARTWAVIEMTQQSKRTENLTAMQRSGAGLGRFLYQFVSSPVQQLAFEVQAVREALAARGTDHAKEAYSHLYRVLVVNHLLMPNFLYLASVVGALPLGKVPDKESAFWDMFLNTLLGQYGCIFLAGAVAEGTLTGLLKGKFDYRDEGLPVNGILDLFKQLGVDVHDLLTWNNDEFAKDAIRSLKLLGAPARHAATAIENWGTSKGEKRRRKNLKSWSR